MYMNHLDAYIDIINLPTCLAPLKACNACGTCDGRTHSGCLMPWIQTKHLLVRIKAQPPICTLYSNAQLCNTSIARPRSTNLSVSTPHLHPTLVYSLSQENWSTSTTHPTLIPQKLISLYPAHRATTPWNIFPIHGWKYSEPRWDIGRRDPRNDWSYSY